MKDFILFGKPEIRESDIQCVVETLNTGWISTGPRVKEFEDSIKEYIGCRNVIALNSCTSGLFLSLLCNDIGKGDEVIVPSMTFCSTVNVVEHIGAKPVFVDINPDTYCMDTKLMKEAITDKTKAVIPVHYAGRPCDMYHINKYAKENDIFVLEDSAHAIGATYKGKKIGSSNTCCFSFYPTKNITTVEGGVVTTDNDELAEKIKIFSNHGLSADAWKRYSNQKASKYNVVVPGYKFNLTDVNASLGINQLNRILHILYERRKYADLYKEKLKNIKGIKLPDFSMKDDSSWHLFPILVEQRDKFRDLLYLANVGTGIHYEAVHLQPYYKKKYKKVELPITEYVSERTVSIPLQTSILEEHIVYICEKIRYIMEKLL